MDYGLVLAGFGGLLLLAFIGLPLGFSMMVVGFFGFAWVRGFVPAEEVVGQQIIDLAMNQGFSVLPLFLLMGAFVYRAALSNDIYEAAYAWLGHFRGGLSMTTVTACAGFAAVSGSSVATAATMAKVSIPPMRRYNYSDSFAIGSVAAGGTIGILIPPSAAMIIYGILTEVDVGKMFIAGILPGLLTVLVYIVVIVGVTRVRPTAGPPGERTDMAIRLRTLSRIWGLLVLFLLVLGGIYFGVFTPTEAGGIGAVGALLFAILRRKMSVKGFIASLAEAGRTTAMVFSVAFGAMIFNQFVNISGLPGAVVSEVQALNLSPVEVILIICLFYVALGCVVEGIGMILLTVPIFFPMIDALGINPIWFGIIVIMVTEISLITPPIGLNVFVMKSMLPEVPLGTIYRGIMPFFAGDLVRLGLVIAFPPIAVYLPEVMH